MRLPNDIYMYNMTKHLIILNLSIFEPWVRQLANCPSDADFPDATKNVAMLCETPLVRLSKLREEPYQPIYEI